MLLSSDTPRLRGHARDTLPAIVSFVAELYQQPFRFFLEDSPVALGEIVSPIPGYALAQEGFRILYPEGPVTGPALEAVFLDDPAHQLLVGIGAQEMHHLPEELFRTLEKLFVPYLEVSFGEQPRADVSRVRHDITPVISQGSQSSLVEDALLSRTEAIGVLVVGVPPPATFEGEGEEPAPILRRSPTVEYGGHRMVPPVTDYVDDPCLRVEIVDLLEVMDGRGCLVPNYELAGPRTSLGEHIVHGQAHESSRVEVYVFFPGPAAVQP